MRGIEILAYKIQVELSDVDKGVAPQIFHLLEEGLNVILHPVVSDRVLVDGLDRLLDELLQGVAIVVEL